MSIRMKEEGIVQSLQSEVVRDTTYKYYNDCWRDDNKEMYTENRYGERVSPGTILSKLPEVGSYIRMYEKYQFVRIHKDDTEEYCCRRIPYPQSSTKSGPCAFTKKDMESIYQVVRYDGDITHPYSPKCRMYYKRVYPYDTVASSEKMILSRLIACGHIDVQTYTKEEVLEMAPNFEEAR